MPKDREKWFRQKIEVSEPNKKEIKQCKKIIAAAKKYGVDKSIVDSMVRYFKKNDKLTDKQKSYLLSLTEQAINPARSNIYTDCGPDYGSGEHWKRDNDYSMDDLGHDAGWYW